MTHVTSHEQQSTCRALSTRRHTSRTSGWHAVAGRVGGRPFLLHVNRASWRWECGRLVYIDQTAAQRQRPAKSMAFNKDALYELCRLARIACTIPITTASAERSFSSWKRIKTHLRTTMCNERLTDLAMLSINSRRAKKIHLERVVDWFINMYPNCR